MYDGPPRPSPNVRWPSEAVANKTGLSDGLGGPSYELSANEPSRPSRRCKVNVEWKKGTGSERQQTWNLRENVAGSVPAPFSCPHFPRVAEPFRNSQKPLLTRFREWRILLAYEVKHNVARASGRRDSRSTWTGLHGGRPSGGVPADREALCCPHGCCGSAFPLQRCGSREVWSAPPTRRVEHHPIAPEKVKYPSPP